MNTTAKDDWIFLRRLLIALAVVGLAYVAWKITPAFLLVFASILLAILLTGLAGLVERHAFVGPRWSLLVASLGLVAVLVGFGVLFGFQLAGQVADVITKLPGALDAAGRQLGIANAAERVQTALTSDPGGQVFLHAASIGYTVVGGVVDLVLVIVAAVYLAADPKAYQLGLAKLFPPNHHERLLDAMQVTAAALRLWFVGQLASMAVVGVLSAVAFWLIGLPSAVALGIIAGLTNFVPLIGPLLGAVPAVLFAFTIDNVTVLWTVGAIIAIQQIEGYVAMPLIQRRAVALPPALVLFALTGFGLLFGWLGVVFAVPFAVSAAVLVQKLWVREALGEKAVVPGERNARLKRAR